MVPYWASVGVQCVTLCGLGVAFKGLSPLEISTIQVKFTPGLYKVRL